MSLAEKIRQEEKLSPPPNIEKPTTIVHPVFPVEALDNTLFGEYIEAYRNKNETCDAFHFAELLSAVSALVGRRVAVDIGLELYPNFYSILIGEPGEARKTFSVKRCIKLIEKHDYSVNIENHVASYEGFIQSWSDSEESRCLIAAGELQNIIITNKREVTSNILPQITRIYDNESVLTHKLKKYGKTDNIEVNEPFLSLLGAITPSLVDQHFTRDNFGSGFVSRLNFYIAEKTNRCPRLDAPDSRIGDVHDRLGRLSTNNRVYTFDEETDAIYCDWYINLKHEGDNDLIRQSSVRLETQVPKLAGILCWLREGKNIDINDFATACRIGEYWLSTAKHLFSNFTDNEKTRDDMLVLETIEHLGGTATKSQLSEKLKRRIDAERRTRILDSLVANGQIEVEMYDNTGGAPKFVYSIS